MALLQAIVINDGAATPVAHTFNPSARVGDTAKLFENINGGLLAARPELTLVGKALGAGGRKTELKDVTLVVPVTVTETVNGVVQTRILGYDKLVISHVACAASNDQSRKNLRVLGSNLLTNSVIASWMDKAEGLTG